MCTYELPMRSILLPHLICSDSVKLMLEGRLQAKTTVVLSFVSARRQTQVRGNGAVTLFLAEADVDDKERR